MFHFRLDKLRIDKNREQGGPLGLGKDLAELEIWSFIATANQQFPDMGELLIATDSDRRKELIAEMAKVVLEERKTIKVDKIKDGAEMSFGFDLWRSDTPPDFFDWNLVVIELDKQDKTTQIVQDITSNTAFTEIADGLPGKLIGAANPGFKAATEIAKLIIGVVQSENKADNDTVGALFKSFSKMKHYPDPTNKAEEKDIEDITSNMWVDFSMYSD